MEVRTLKNRSIPIALVVFITMIMVIPSIKGEQDEYIFESEFENSDGSETRLIQYEEISVFYQDVIQEIVIKNITDEARSIALHTVNCSLNLFHPEYGYYDWDWYWYDYYYLESPYDLLSEEFLDGFNRGFYIYPNELDRNYWIELELVVEYKDNTTYSERHNIWVIGEPRVLEGEISDDLDDIPIFYLISAICSVLFWSLILIIGYFTRKGRGLT